MINIINFFNQSKSPWNIYKDSFRVFLKWILWTALERLKDYFLGPCVRHSSWRTAASSSRSSGSRRSRRRRSRDTAPSCRRGLCQTRRSWPRTSWGRRRGCRWCQSCRCRSKPGNKFEMFFWKFQIIKSYLYFKIPILLIESFLLPLPSDDFGNIKT